MAGAARSFCSRDPGASGDHRVTVATILATVVVSLWGASPAAPTVAPHRAGDDGPWGVPARNGTDASVGTVHHCCPARRPRRHPGHRHRHQRHRRLEWRRLGAAWRRARRPRRRRRDAPTSSSSSPTTCATTTSTTCRSPGDCSPTRAWSSPTRSPPTRCAARHGPSSPPASTPRTTASSTTAACMVASRPSTPARRRASWFRDAGYRTGFVGKFLNGYGPRDLTTDRLDALGRPDPRRLRLRELLDDRRRRPAALHRQLHHVRHRGPHQPDGARLRPQRRPVRGATPGTSRRTTGSPRGRSRTAAGAARRPGPVPRRAPVVVRRPGVQRGGRDRPAVLPPQRCPASPAEVRAENTARLQSLQAVDRAVGSLVETLDQQGVLDDTYIVFTSDNGYSLGEHRFVGKDVLTDEALQVPLLVRGPGIAPGTTSDLPVTLVDLPATFAALTGVTPQWQVDGTSLAPTLTGESQAFRDTTLIQTGRTLGNGWSHRGVRTDRYLYGTDGVDGFLYDRLLDPDEMVNLVDDPAYADVVATLEQRRRELVTCAGWTCNQQFGPVPDPVAPTRRSRPDAGRRPDPRDRGHPSRPGPGAPGRGLPARDHRDRRGRPARRRLRRRRPRPGAPGPPPGRRPVAGLRRTGRAVHHRAQPRHDGCPAHARRAGDRAADRHRPDAVRPHHALDRQHRLAAPAGLEPHQPPGRAPLRGPGGGPRRLRADGGAAGRDGHRRDAAPDRRPAAAVAARDVRRRAAGGAARPRAAGGRLAGVPGRRPAVRRGPRARRRGRRLGRRAARGRGRCALPACCATYARRG